MALDTIPLQAFERTAKFVATPKQSALVRLRLDFNGKYERLTCWIYRRYATSYVSLDCKRYGAHCHIRRTVR